MAGQRNIPKFLRQWRRRYPLPFDWVDDGANKRLRRSETEWLSQFAGATSLKRREIAALADWRFAAEPDAKKQAMGGIEGHLALGLAQRCIRRALKEPSATNALDHLLAECGGVPGWAPDMASAVLAAAQPDRYVVADERRLRTLRALGLCAPHATGAFLRADWWQYLATCRSLATECGMSLRAVGQALWAAADDAPELPGKPKRRARRS
jgi:hypothetical protein